MRVLLVTWTEQLQQKLSILNPELEYCAIVVDEVKPAKEILKRVGLPATLLHPLYDLKECVRDFYYNYVLCVENWWWCTALSDIIKEYGVPRDKVLNFCAPYLTINFFLERSLRYFKEHASEFDMFATGISYVEKCFDITKFKHKLFNFGRGSQDLYYNFQIAKRAVVYGGGGDNKLRYALIGLAPYSFHYDLSKTPRNQFTLLQHFIAFNDLHNFHMPSESYRKIFCPEYLSIKLDRESLDINDPYFVKDNLPNVMTLQNRLDIRKKADHWNERYFPNTRDENVKILDDYLTLCEENHIRPIMFFPPMTEGYMKHFNRRMLDEFYYIVDCACQRHPSAIFVDGQGLPFLTDSDFYDYGHLNRVGAMKFSIFMNDFIEHI